MLVLKVKEKLNVSIGLTSVAVPFGHEILGEQNSRTSTG